MFRLSLLAGYANDAIEQRSSSSSSLDLPLTKTFSPIFSTSSTENHRMPLHMVNPEDMMITPSGDSYSTRTRILYCRKCEGHGKQAILKGHAPTCPYNMCGCKSCSKLMSKRLLSFNKRNQSRLEAAAAITASKSLHGAHNHDNLAMQMRRYTNSFGSESSLIGSLSMSGQHSSSLSDDAESSIQSQTPPEEREQLMSSMPRRSQQSSSAEPFLYRSQGSDSDGRSASVQILNDSNTMIGSSENSNSMIGSSEIKHNHLKRCLETAKSEFAMGAKRSNLDLPTTSGAAIDPNKLSSIQFVTLPTIPAVNLVLDLPPQQSIKSTSTMTTTMTTNTRRSPLPLPSGSIGIAKSMQRTVNGQHQHQHHHQRLNTSTLADPHGLGMTVRPTPTIAPSIIRQHLSTTTTMGMNMMPSMIVSRPVPLPITSKQSSPTNNNFRFDIYRQQQLINAYHHQQQQQQKMLDNNDNPEMMRQLSGLHDSITDNAIMASGGNKQLTALQQASLQSLQNVQAMQHKNAYFQQLHQFQLQQQQQQQEQQQKQVPIGFNLTPSPTFPMSMSSMTSLALPTMSSDHSNNNLVDQMTHYLLLQQQQQQQHQQQRLLLNNEEMKMTSPSPVSSFQLEQHPLTAVPNCLDPVHIQSMIQQLKNLQQSLSAYSTLPCAT